MAHSEPMAVDTITMNIRNQLTPRTGRDGGRGRGPGPPGRWGGRGRTPHGVRSNGSVSPLPCSWGLGPRPQGQNEPYEFLLYILRKRSYFTTKSYFTVYNPTCVKRRYKMCKKKQLICNV